MAADRVLTITSVQFCPGVKQTTNVVAWDVDTLRKSAKVRIKKMRAVFMASDGILREVNNICYEALLAGAERSEKRIDEQLVEWVVDQRDLA